MTKLRSIRHERVVHIAGGRRVGLTDHGDPDGRPAFFMHGVPGSRAGNEFVDEPARERGVRVLCVERPGVGLSDPEPEHSIAGWADDVAALADVLGIGTFAVVGHSAGCPYALACAARLPDRVGAAAVLAGGGPLDRPGATDSLSAFSRRILPLAAHRPAVARAMLASMGLSVRWARPLVLRGFMNSMCEPDRRAWQGLEGYEDAVIDFMTESFRQGSRAALTAFQLWPRPWGFDLGDIRVPVHLWYGEDDPMVGVDHGEDLARRLPDARLRVLPGTGHFSVLDHFGAVLDELPEW